MYEASTKASEFYQELMSRNLPLPTKCEHRAVSDEVDLAWGFGPTPMLEMRFAGKNVTIVKDGKSTTLSTSGWTGDALGAVASLAKL